MSETRDRASVVIHPPIAWAIAFVVGVGADRLYPLSFVPPPDPRAWVGGLVFAAGFVLAIWAIVTMRKAGTRVEIHKPTTTIVVNGPYRVTRNPIYIGMLLGQTGLAIGLDSLWLLATLVPFFLVIRYGVIAREEAFLERKFGTLYLGYMSGVRRWM